MMIHRRRFNLAAVLSASPQRPSRSLERGPSRRLERQSRQEKHFQTTTSRLLPKRERVLHCPPQSASSSLSLERQSRQETQEHNIYTTRATLPSRAYPTGGSGTSPETRRSPLRTATRQQVAWARTRSPRRAACEPPLERSLAFLRDRCRWERRSLMRRRAKKPKMTRRPEG